MVHPGNLIYGYFATKRICKGCFLFKYGSLYASISNCRGGPPVCYQFGIYHVFMSVHVSAGLFPMGCWRLSYPWGRRSKMETHLGVGHHKGAVWNTLGTGWFMKEYRPTIYTWYGNLPVLQRFHISPPLSEPRSWEAKMLLKGIRWDRKRPFQSGVSFICN